MSDTKPLSAAELAECRARIASTYLVMSEAIPVAKEAFAAVVIPVFDHIAALTAERDELIKKCKDIFGIAAKKQEQAEAAEAELAKCKDSIVLCEQGHIVAPTVDTAKADLPQDTLLNYVGTSNHSRLKREVKSLRMELDQAEAELARMRGRCTVESLSDWLYETVLPNNVSVLDRTACTALARDIIAHITEDKNG